MDFISKKITEYMHKLRRDRRWRNVMLSLAAVVVFGTTYALILPAITMDEETAIEEAGVELVFEEVEIAADDSAPDDASESSPAQGADTSYTDDSASLLEDPDEADLDDEITYYGLDFAEETDAPEVQQTEQTEYVEDVTPVAEIDEQLLESQAQVQDVEPVQQTANKDETIRQLRYQDDEITVTVEWHRSITVPAGTQLSVRELTKKKDKALLAYCQDETARLMEESGYDTLIDPHYLVITIEDADGAQLYPNVKADVTIEYNTGMSLNGDEEAFVLTVGDDRLEALGDIQILYEDNACWGYVYETDSFEDEAVITCLMADRVMGTEEETAAETEVAETEESESEATVVILETEVQTETETETETETSAETEIYIIEETANETEAAEAETAAAEEEITEEAVEEEAAVESVYETTGEAEQETEELTEAETETESETEAKTVEFTGSANEITVTVTAGEGAFPEGTTMVVTAIEDTDVISAALDAVEGENVRAAAVDITFYDAEGNEVEPLLPIRVTMQADVIAENEDIAVVHVDDELQAEVVEQTAEKELEETPAEDAVIFDAEAFSAYVLVYTVDFTFGDYEYNLEGGTSILLSELIEQIHLVKNDEDDLLTVEEIPEVTFTDDTLLSVAQTEDGDWLLTSLQAFSTEESLTITLKDGGVVTVEVRDDQEATTTTNLNQLITSVSIETNSGETIIGSDGKIVATTGETYQFEFNFQETDALQFANGESLYYTLPAGVSLAAGQSGTFSITIDNRVITGNTYTVTDDGRIKIDFNTAHRNFRFLENSTDVTLKMEFSGSISSEATQLKFSYSDSLIYTVDHYDKHDASVAKYGYYDSSSGKMYYKAVVFAEEGSATDIRVIDACLGSALGTPTITGVYYSDQWGNNNNNGNSTAINYTGGVVSNGSGFDITITDTIPQGQYVTVAYEVPIDYSQIATSGNAQFSETGNEVTIEVPGDDDTTNNTATHIESGINFSSISKNNTAVSEIIEKNGTKYRLVTWKITANTERKVSLMGTSITDTLYSGTETTFYYGDGISVVKIAPDGTRSDAESVSWAALGVTDTSNSWSYQAEDDGNYGYEITYQTKVDITSWDDNQTKEVINVASDKYGEDTGRISITNYHEPNVPKVSKNAITYSEETSTWKVTVDIPAGWSGTLSLDEVAPCNVYPYTDTFESIKIDGLGDIAYPDITYLTGRDQTYEELETISGSNKLIIDFGSIAAATTNRTVTITLVTNNNQEWVEAADGERWIQQEGHKNNVTETYTNEAGEPETDSATAQSDPNLEKIGKTAEVVNLYYVTYDPEYISYEFPAYKFTVSIQGALEKDIDISDSFDTSLFKVLSVSNDSKLDLSSVAANLQIYNAVNGYNTGEAATTTSIEVEETASGAIFHISNLERTADNIPYPIYNLTYYLVPKYDDESIDAIQTAIDKIDQYVIEQGTLTGTNGNADGRTYAFTNKATWNGNTAEVDFERSVSGIISKTGSDNGNGTYSYTVTLNPDKRKINDGVNYELTDVFSGVQVDKTSIQVAINGQVYDQGNLWKMYSSESAAAADNFDGVIIIYDGESDTIMTVEIPDELEVVITYNAKSKGEVEVDTTTGKAVETVTNTATALDYHCKVEFTHQYDVISKSKTANTDGTRTFTVDFNPSKLKLNGGQSITLTDTYTGGLSIDSSSFRVICDPDDEANTTAAAVLASKDYDETNSVYTFTVPDSTHVTITYIGSLVYTTDENGISQAEYSNTVSGVNVNKVVSETVEGKVLTKSAGAMETDEESEGYGAIPFTIEFNPLALTLNDGEVIELEDTSNNLKILYNTIEITPAVYPTGYENAGDPIAYDYEGDKATFWIPDSTRVVIKYYARPDYTSGDNVSWSNTVEAKGYYASQNGTSQKDSSASGSGHSGNAIWLYKYEEGHMERPLTGAKFALSYFDATDNTEKIVTDTSGAQIIFETIEDVTMGTGYVYIELTDKQGYPLGLSEDTIYILTEKEPPEGYNVSTESYYFVIDDDGTFVKPGNYSGDVNVYNTNDILRVTNEKITHDITVSKKWVNADGTTTWPSNVDSVQVKLQQKVGENGDWKDISVANRNIPSYYWNSDSGTTVIGADGSTWNSTLTLSGSNATDGWNHLDYTINHEDISYQVVEVSAGGNDVNATASQVTVNGTTYDVLTSDVSSAGVVTITNAERKDMTFTKTWSGLVNDTVTITIPSGASVGTATGVVDNGNGTVTIPASMIWSVVELKRYDSSGNEVEFDSSDQTEAAWAGAKMIGRSASSSYASGASFAELGNWQAVWRDLPTAVMASDGTKIEYTYKIVETAVYVSRETLSDGTDSDYVNILNSFTSTSNEDGTSITNTLKQGTSLTVKKEWYESNGTTALINGHPSSIKFQLIRVSGSTETVINAQYEADADAEFELSASNQWKTTFSDLPATGASGESYTYKVEELTNDLTGFTVSYEGNSYNPATTADGTITIKNTENVTGIKVVKTWTKNNFQVALVENLPESIEVQLQRSTSNGDNAVWENVESSGDSFSATYTVTVTVVGNQDWSVRRSASIIVNSGASVTVDLDAYNVSRSSTISYAGVSDAPMEVINVNYQDRLRYTISNITQDITAVVSTNDGNTGKVNPNLLTNSEASTELVSDVSGKAILSADNNWTYEWQDLPAGYYYRVAEVASDALDGYSVDYDNNDGITTGKIIVKNNLDHVDQGYELPSTGGSGTKRYIGSGIGLLFMAAWILYIKQKWLLSTASSEIVGKGGENSS